VVGWLTVLLNEALHVLLLLMLFVNIHTTFI